MSSDFFDAHCHLQDVRLAPVLPQVLARARAAGVSQLICCGARQDDWLAVRQLARREPDLVIPAFGLHPWFTDSRGNDWLSWLEELLCSCSSGVGEIGLDFALPQTTWPVQEEVFISQLYLAKKLKRPVIIHCHRAWDRLTAIIQEQGGLGNGGLLHAWSGPVEKIKLLEKMGFYISFSGVITHWNERKARQLLSAVSNERILLETDSPDMPPASLGHVLNEPANLPLIMAAAAELCGEAMPSFICKLRENANGFLRLISHNFTPGK